MNDKLKIDPRVMQIDVNSGVSLAVVIAVVVGMFTTYTAYSDGQTLQNDAINALAIKQNDALNILALKQAEADIRYTESTTHISQELGRLTELVRESVEDKSEIKNRLLRVEIKSGINSL